MNTGGKSGTESTPDDDLFWKSAKVREENKGKKKWMAVVRSSSPETLDDLFSFPPLPPFVRSEMMD